MHLYFISSLMLPIFGPFYFWLRPEFPVKLLRFPAHFNVAAITIFNFLHNVSALLCDAAAWMLFSGSCCFCVINVFMVTCFCLTSYVHLLRFKAERAILSGGSSVKKVVLLYREVQLLHGIFVAVLSESQLMILFQLMGSAVQIFSSYLIIRMYATLGLTQWILVLLMGMDAILFSGLVFGEAAKLYQSSVHMIDVSSRNSTCRRDPWLRRYCRSLSPLKVPFGVEEFVGNLTPLGFLNFNIFQTVNLLLLPQ